MIMEAAALLKRSPHPTVSENAIYDAAGIRLRRLPFTPSRIIAALHAG
jgi:hypothetical protein